MQHAMFVVFKLYSPEHVTSVTVHMTVFHVRNRLMLFLLMMT